MVARVESISELSSLLPPAIAEGTKEDEIFHIITTIECPHLIVGLIVFLKRTRNAGTHPGVCISSGAGLGHGNGRGLLAGDQVGFSRDPFGIRGYFNQA
jgi:pyruvoyl-dependent arginine decarboxylase (PvlArgDC)